MSGYVPNPTLGGFQHSLDQAFPGRTMNEYEGPGCNQTHENRNSAHCTGEAVDIWPDPKHGLTGDEIAQRATQTPGVDEVIWNRRIWRPWNGWQAWPSKYKNGKPTDPHTDHVHVQVPRAARGTPAVKKARRKKVVPTAALPDKFNLASADGPSSSGGASGGGGDDGSGGDRIMQGEPSVVLGGEQLMAAHKETPHTGGGRIAKGSQTVMVGPKMLDFARIGDPTTDQKNVVTGHQAIFVG